MAMTEVDQLTEIFAPTEEEQKMRKLNGLVTIAGSSDIIYPLDEILRATARQLTETHAGPGHLHIYKKEIWEDALELAKHSWRYEVRRYLEALHGLPWGSPVEIDQSQLTGEVEFPGAYERSSSQIYTLRRERRGLSNSGISIRFGIHGSSVDEAPKLESWWTEKVDTTVIKKPSVVLHLGSGTGNLIAYDDYYKFDEDDPQGVVLLRERRHFEPSPKFADLS